MFVMTAKISKPRLIAIGAALLAAVFVIVLLVNSGGSAETPSSTLPVGATNDERLAYLASFGWSVNGEPTETQKVRIPTESDNRVFSRYNDLQLSQGFDLTEYAGKEVMRFVYEVLNYPDATAPVYASVLVYNGCVIGGDITDTSPNGVMHGFAADRPSERESVTVPSSEPTIESTEPTTVESETTAAPE